jgi:hypothetical protein
MHTHSRRPPALRIICLRPRSTAFFTFDGTAIVTGSRTA